MFFLEPRRGAISAFPCFVCSPDAAYLGPPNLLIRWCWGRVVCTLCSSLYILKINPLDSVYLAKIFPLLCVDADKSFKIPLTSAFSQVHAVVEYVSLPLSGSPSFLRSPLTIGCFDSPYTTYVTNLLTIYIHGFMTA